MYTFSALEEFDQLCFEFGLEVEEAEAEEEELQVSLTTGINPFLNNKV